MNDMRTEQMMFQMLFGPNVAQLIHVAAKLGIADQLKVGRMTCGELAETLSVHPPTLYRVMRTLAGLGIFAETDKANFELTPLAELLRSDNPNSVRNLAIMMGEEFFWQAKAKLLHSVKTGEVAFGEAHGMGVFEYFQRNTDAAEIFDRAMTDSTLNDVEGILAAYDFSGINKLIDVGGGRGLLIARILKAYPEMKGVLADMDSVIEDATKLLESEGVADRCESNSIDFFESVPSGGDAYMLRHIIHDWDDERAITILKNCHKQMNKSASLLH